MSGYLTEDDRYLVISASTSGNKLFINIYKEKSNLISVIDHFDSDTYVEMLEVNYIWSLI